MTLKKYGWIVLVAALLLPSLASCLLEDRSLDEGEVFVCQSDEDCFSNSECVKEDPKDKLGRCVMSSKVKHCVDRDKDGYESAMDPTDKDQITECAFSEESPIDCNDADGNVNPGAEERCNNKDDDCDGCVDGTCPEKIGNCKDSPDKCEPLTTLCYGLNSGVGVCKGMPNKTCSKGKWQDSSCESAEHYHFFNGNETIFIKKGDDNILSLCDGLDNDCDGAIDAKDCSDLFCYVKGGKVVVVKSQSDITENPCGTGEIKDCNCVGNLSVTGAVTSCVHDPKYKKLVISPDITETSASCP